MPKNWQMKYKLAKVNISDWDMADDIETKEDVIHEFSF
jgi:hypothetical protein